MTSSFSIEPVRSSDIPSLIEIADECDLSFWSHQGFMDELARNDSVMLLIRADAAIAGFIIGRVVPGNSPETTSEAEIYNIGVAKEFRRRGAGRELLKAFVERCCMTGSGAIWLEVRASNSNAVNFYESCGFQAQSIRKGFYSNPAEDAIIMRSTLPGSKEKTGSNNT